MKRDAGSYFEAAKMVENLLDGVGGGKKLSKIYCRRLKRCHTVNAKEFWAKNAARCGAREIN